MDKSQAEGGTRSGLLWEVERILDELNAMGKDHLCQILVCENVPELIGTKNIENFKKWELKLESLGYTNFVKILNAKDYGIPQNRRRVFVVSILGDYAYDMPIGMKLKYHLKDFLEKEVDEKYYLTSEKIKQISSWKAQQDPLKDIDKEKKIVPTLTARGAGEEHSGMILINEDTIKGYAKATDGDGVYINRPQQKRGVVQKGMIQTIKANNSDIGVVVNDEPKLIGGFGEKKSNGGKQWYQQDRVYDSEGIAMCHPANLPEGSYKYLDNKLRIRKLTPKECIRLMGFEDSDYEAIKSVDTSDAMIYHQSGDSIVVTCLIALFSPFFSEPSNHREIISKYVDNLIDDHIDEVDEVDEVDENE